MPGLESGVERPSATDAAGAAPASRSWLRHPAVKIGLGLALLAGFGIALSRTWSDFGAVQWQFEPVPAVTAFLILVAVTVAPVPLWLVIVHGLGAELELRPALRVYLVSGIAKYLPGKVLHAVGRVVMLQDQGVSPKVGITSVLLEVVLFLLAAPLVSLSSLPLLVDQGMAYLVPLMLLAVPVGLVLLYPPILRRVLDVAAQFVPGLRGAVCEELLLYSTVLKLLLGYAALWIGLSAGLYVAALAVHPIDPGWAPVMGGIVAISYIAGLAVPIAPSGLGVRDGLTTLLLGVIMPLPAAAATSLLYRALSLAAEAASAAVASRL